MSQFCFICNKLLTEDKTVVVNRGMPTLINASVARSDEFADYLRSQKSVTIHVDCRKSYTRKTSISASKRQREEEQASTSKNCAMDLNRFDELQSPLVNQNGNETSSNKVHQNIQKTVVYDWKDAAEVSRLISLVKKRPGLWDVFSPEYKHTKDDAWKEVAKDLGNGIDWNEAKIKWINLKATFRTYMAKLSSKKSSMGTNESAKTAWMHFEEMMFVKMANVKQMCESTSSFNSPKEIVDPTIIKEEYSITSPCIVIRRLSKLDSIPSSSPRNFKKVDNHTLIGNHKINDLQLMSLEAAKGAARESTSSSTLPISTFGLTIKEELSPVLSASIEDQHETRARLNSNPTPTPTPLNSPRPNCSENLEELKVCQKHHQQTDIHSMFGDYIASESRSLPDGKSDELKDRICRTLFDYKSELRLAKSQAGATSSNITVDYIQENFAIVKRATTTGLMEFFIAPKRYFKTQTEVYWPKNEELVGKNHVSNVSVMPESTWDLYNCQVILWLETERDANKLLTVYLKTCTSDEEACVENYIMLHRIRAKKPPLITTRKRKFEDSCKEITPQPNIRKTFLTRNNELFATKNKMQASNDLPENILPSPLAIQKKSLQTPNHAATFPQELLEDILKGINEINSRLDTVEKKVDECTSAVVTIKDEQKRMTDIHVSQNESEIEMDDDFVKDIENSFPIENSQTLERFNTVFGDPKYVLRFVKIMSDLHIKDSGISNGKKLIRSFIDHFFTRKFMLQINRTGIRRSAGPPKIKLEGFENILKTFHKCIKVGVPNFGFEGTKKTLWRLCDTAMQRFKDEEFEDAEDSYSHDIYDEFDEAVGSTFEKAINSDNEFDSE